MVTTCDNLQMFQHRTRPCDDADGCQAARPWIERTTVAPEGMIDQWQERLGWRRWQLYQSRFFIYGLFVSVFHSLNMWL